MKYVTILCVALMLSACGVSMNVNGKVYPTYGIVNEKVNKSSKMCYEVSIGNVVWSVILVRTIVAPIYFIGNWSEGGGGEVHRVDDTLLLYYVPCYGGEGELVLKAHISGHELVVDTVYSWT